MTDSKKLWLEGLPKQTLVEMVLKQSNEIDRLQQQKVTPEGWMLVPVEPTKQMIEACLKVHRDWLDDDNADLYQPVQEEYKAMLVAAPSIA